jgi:hypothetical protein
MNQVELWDLKRWKKMASLGRNVLSVSLTGDRERVLLASFDGNAKIVEARKRRSPTTLLGHGATINDEIVGEQRPSRAFPKFESYRGSRFGRIL